MSKIKNIAVYLIIAVVSVILVLAWGRFQSDAFLIDDNRTQWFPIIEKAYADFFETGTMPFYNFYLSKGLAIAEPGYYSLNNPLMLLSYIIAHYLPFGYTTIVIYICILVVSGNVILYRVCREIKCSIPVSAATVAAYFTCSAFFSNCIWYYVFINYMFVPLLIWAFIRFRGTKYEFFGYGVILAFDLLMGNVQYTCYHYIVFCLICVTMIIVKEFRYIKVMFSNIATGILLSLPYFALLLRSAGGFNHEGFLTYRIKLMEYLVNSFIPKALINNFVVFFAEENSPYLSLKQYMGGISSALMVCLIAAVITKLKQMHQNRSAEKPKKQKKQKSEGIIHTIYVWIIGLYNRICRFDFQDKLFLGIIVCSIFFLLLLDRGIVAYILNCVPVINQFRYLYKAVFLIAALAPLVMAFVLSKQNKAVRTAAVSISIVFSLVGVVNNFYLMDFTNEKYYQSEFHSFDEEKEIIERYIADSDIDTKNYRTICLFRDPYRSSDGHWQTNSTSFEYYENMSRNFMAYTECFSLSAYEISTSEERLEQFDKIFDSEELYSVYANAGRIGFFSDNMTEFPQELDAQLVTNGIRYILVENTNIPYTDGVDYTAEIVEQFEKLENVSVARIGRFSECYDLIELEGVNSLCIDENGGFTELVDDKMDLLRFTAEGSESYKLSFAYDKNLKAYLMSGGEKTILEITEAEDGNAVIRTNGASGEVYLTYDSALCTVSMVMEIVITAAFVAVFSILIFLSAGKNKEA